MFTTPCFIRKNTKELRDKLNAIGHKLNHGKVWGRCLCVFQTEDSDEWRYVASPLLELEDMPNYENSIDCGDNEELFLYTAALRDDSDNFQLFFNNKDFDCEYPTECIHDEFHMFAIDQDTCERIDHTDEYHKGTPKELQKHFLK